VLLAKLPAGLGFGDALTIAGGMHRLEAVDFSVVTDKRYTFWTGVLGGGFLALSYFGTDQSQVQRYLGGASLRESRLGLMFNALFKIPMQFFILLLGVLVFVLYQFEQPPVYFNEAAWSRIAANGGAEKLRAIENDFAVAHAAEQQKLNAWLAAKRGGDAATAESARVAALAAHEQVEATRDRAKEAVAGVPGKKSNDGDYVFITFILHYLPHGVIGLLVTVFFAAALSSKAGELNALASTSVVDFYRFVIQPGASDRHYVIASKCFTAFWGIFAIAVALLANLSENLIQASNILGSLFYGVPLGIFLVAFFMKKIGGTAVFWAGIVSLGLVWALYATLSISYLWYNLIGCAACMILAAILQPMIGGRKVDPV
jgi:uncharacterized sodium:solute symporter family permease YidK